MARRAKSLDTFVKQLDTQYPNRSKASDGWLGDAAHQAKASDHNPNSKGVVLAQDITHDPKHGLDIQKLADKLVASKDTRIKYIIANRKIWENGVWKTYTGSSDPHTNHLHLSVNAVNYDDARDWNIKGGDMPTLIDGHDIEWHAKNGNYWHQVAEDRQTVIERLENKIQDLEKNGGNPKSLVAIKALKEALNNV